MLASVQRARWTPAFEKCFLCSALIQAPDWRRHRHHQWSYLSENLHLCSGKRAVTRHYYMTTGDQRAATITDPMNVRGVAAVGFVSQALATNDAHDQAAIPKSFTEAIYFCPDSIQKAAVPFRKPWLRFSREARALPPLRKTCSRRTVPRDEISI